MTPDPLLFIAWEHGEDGRNPAGGCRSRGRGGKIRRHQGLPGRFGRIGSMGRNFATYAYARGEGEGYGKGLLMRRRESNSLSSLSSLISDKTMKTQGKKRGGAAKAAAMILPPSSLSSHVFGGKDNGLGFGFIQSQDMGQSE